MHRFKKTIQVLLMALLISSVPISAIAGLGCGSGNSSGNSSGNGKGQGSSVPEPTTLLLLASGAGVLLIKRYWKKK